MRERERCCSFQKNLKKEKNQFLVISNIIYYTRPAAQPELAAAAEHPNLVSSEQPHPQHNSALTYADEPPSERESE